MSETRTPEGYRDCQCGHNLMQHIIQFGGVCTKYPCPCVRFEQPKKDQPR